ncbi:unnamed protein product [Schistocephalus solidus]|uniref:CRAL-TRIO domain-containing protein n=1 Tax=Schistocephalus solidus TaxID=70667 RepID=A0A183TU15_SCHSO|nr:unnamed protein product [Schistocephalus solidus]
MLALYENFAEVTLDVCASSQARTDWYSYVVLYALPYYLSCLWAQISSMRSAGWKEHVLWKISDAFPALRESGQSCKFSQITPPDYDSEIVYPLPQVVFRMFDYTDVYSAEDEDTEQDNQASSTKAESSAATLPGAHTIERFLIDEQLHIILETMNFNRVLW